MKKNRVLCSVFIKSLYSMNATCYPSQFTLLPTLHPFFRCLHIACQKTCCCVSVFCPSVVWLYIQHITYIITRFSSSNSFGEGRWFLVKKYQKIVGMMKYPAGDFPSVLADRRKHKLCVQTSLLLCLLFRTSPHSGGNNRGLKKCAYSHKK